MGIYCTIVRRQISCHDDYAGTSHIPLSLSGFLPSQNTTYTTKPTLERFSFVCCFSCSGLSVLPRISRVIQYITSLALLYSTELVQRRSEMHERDGVLSSRNMPLPPSRITPHPPSGQLRQALAVAVTLSPLVYSFYRRLLDLLELRLMGGPSCLLL